MKKVTIVVVIFTFFLIVSSSVAAEQGKPFNPFKEIPLNDDYQWNLNCMALNIYHESRGEPLIGQLGIAFTVKERVKSPRWKNDVCSVVYSYKQWSWTIDDIPDYVTDKKSYKRAKVIAELALNNEVASPVLGANHVYSTKVYKNGRQPWWAKDMKIVKKIANQVFLKD